jgi:hypothetical protein
MTTPDERMRALRFGRETLSDLTDRTDVPARIRAGAAEVLQRYPTHDDLVALLETESLVLPTAWADALRDARSLLEEVGRMGNLPAGMPFCILATLRHFPEAWLLDVVSRGPVLMTWLAQERD